MIHPTEQLKQQLYQLSREWMTQGLPSREVLNQTAAKLNTWKQQQGVTGIWPQRPLIATATLDDGIGQGLEIIDLYADVVGLQVQAMGLMQKPEQIIKNCRQCRPAIVGLTILQLDSDDDLATIGHNLPAGTLLIAGGPVFKFDPEMARRCGVTFAAANVAYFINYLLNWIPDHGTTTC